MGKWLIAGAVLAMMGLLGFGMLMAGVTGDLGSAYRDQCRQKIGASPSGSETATETTTTTSIATVAVAPAHTYAASDIPSTNPFAEVPTSGLTGYWLDCHNAMQTAASDFETPPAEVPNPNVAAVNCAAELGMQLVQRRTTVAEMSPSVMVQYVVYGASLQPSTNRCAMPTTMAGLQATVPCVQPALQPMTEPVILPNGLAAEGNCGQEVSPSVSPPAMSAGDVVLWGDVFNTPTHVGVAVDATEIVTPDPTGSTYVLQLLQSLPGGDNLRIKRVLAYGSSQ